MKRLITTTLIIFLHLFFVTPVFPGTMIAPWNWKITSDYGPRDCGKTNCVEWFHQAIDYDGPEGADISAVEGGTIDAITYGAGWYIKVGKWTYLHMFTGKNSLPVSSNNWELVSGTLTDSETDETNTDEVIIFWSNKAENRATKALCINKYDGRKVSFKRSKTGNTIVVKDAKGNDIACQGSVDPLEPVGPVGNSGGYPHAHLDLRVNDYRDNPLFYLAHSPDGLPVATIEKPENHHDFTKEEYTNDYKIKVSVNSAGGPDVNRVSMWINVLKDESNKKILSADGNEPTFGYGGRNEAGDKRTSNMVKSTGETTGVQPFLDASGDSLGHDRFIYVQNFKSLNLPGGEHALVVRVTDVDGNSADVISYFTIHNFPTVTSTSPENQSYNVAADSKITITFDGEMNTESVQSAIAVEPVITASYAWSADKKTLTMTPVPGLSANSDYTVTVYDTAKSAAGEQLDGDKDGKAGGSYAFTFSTKKANLTVTELAADYIDGSTYWVKAGAKTVKVQILDENGKAFGTGGTSYNIPQLQVTFANGKSQTISLLPAASLDGWSGTISVASGSDGKAAFSSPNTPVSGIASFMIDTKKPSIKGGNTTVPSCKCSDRAYAVNVILSDSGSGIAQATPVGEGYSFSHCFENGNYAYGVIVEDKVGNISSLSGGFSVYPPPGCDHPDDNYSVNDLAILGSGDDIQSSDTLILQNGYYDSFLSVLQKFNKSGDYLDIANLAIDSSKPLVIPSAGFYGMENSTFLKAALDEYVKNGGTLIVMAQQHGYEYSILPTPDGKPITGYGWTEDQSCQNSSSYIDTYHQVLSSLSKSTPSINVDGYFTSYPENATVLFRRTANGQPSAIIYQHGNGYVIATNYFSDFGYGSGQASAEELAVVRDMVTWAKKPEQLPEVRPGETVFVTMSIDNVDTADAASIKLHIYDPDRKNLLSEQTISQYIPAGTSTELTTQHATLSTSALGIYHIDTEILDSAGNTVKTETDSGRFVVSTPPANPSKPSGLQFAVNSPSENILQGQDVAYTVNIWNYSDKDRKLRLWKQLNHGIDIGFLEEVVVPANDSIARTYTQNINLSGGATLWVTFYEENGTPVSKGWWIATSDDMGYAYAGGVYRTFNIQTPSVSMSIAADKAVYTKGETVNLNLSLQNKQDVAYTTAVKVRIKDPSSAIIHETVENISLGASGQAAQNLRFTIPDAVRGGFYVVSAEAYDSNNRKIGGNYTSFELPKSIVSVSPKLPSSFASGNNTISFALSNTGKISVSSGTVAVSLKDPDGIVAYLGSQPFTLAVGESKILDVPVTLPSLKFGDYKLTYTQSDETREGKPSIETILNSAIIENSFDKPAYRIRETANLTVNLLNIGKFDIENANLTVAVPDANYIDTKTVNIGQGQAQLLQFAIPLPETMASGQHNVNITLTLPSGSSSAKTAALTVTESALGLETSGAVNPAAGDAITVTIENTGGVDTAYSTDKLLIKDSNGLLIYNGTTTGIINSIAGAIKSGERKSYLIQISPQTAMGYVMFDIAVKDAATGKLSSLSKALYVSGVNATLSSQTDKPAYLSSDPVSALNTLVNKDIDITDGMIEIKIIQLNDPYKKPSVESKQLLPKKLLNLPYNTYRVATGKDGAIYVPSYDGILKFDSDGNLITKWRNSGTGETQNYYADAIAVSDSAVYVTDYSNNVVRKFDHNGNFISKWGSYGTGDGQFNQPFGIAVAQDGSVYVLDKGNSRIQKFDADGHFILKWGSYGLWGYNEFNSPMDIAVGSDGSVYVADTGNRKIKKFNANGNYTWVGWGSYGGGNGQFYYPSAISVGSDGYVYVSDRPLYGFDDDTKHRIQKFNSNGQFVTTWGEMGVGNGQFVNPTGLAASPNGFVYVVDGDSNANRRIQKFTSNGSFVSKIGMYEGGAGYFAAPKSVFVATDGSIYVADTANNRIQKFDSSGNFIRMWGNGLFYQPSDIEVSSDGSFYVVDTNNCRIQKFDINGNFVKKWGSCGIGDGQFWYPTGIGLASDGSVYVTDKYNRIQKFDGNGTFIAKWGSNGTADGQFNSPEDVAVSSDGSVYVSDTWNHRIQKFDGNGNFIAKWGNGYGNSDGQLGYPSHILIGPNNTIYVADTYNHCIQKFDSNGNFIVKWGSYGTGDGQLKYPEGIALAPDGSAYVADTSNHRIQKFDSNFSFIMKWGSYDWGDGQIYKPAALSVAPDGSIYLTDKNVHRIQKFDGSGNYILKWGVYGNKDGEFYNPLGIAVGLDGSVYVTDTYNHRIQKFDSSGKIIATFGSYGNADGQFKYPQGMATGPDGSVYVADTSNYRIQKFDNNGDFVKKWGGIGSANGQFYAPKGIAVGPDGSVYVVDSSSYRIQKFDSNGNFITKWGGQLR